MASMGLVLEIFRDGFEGVDHRALLTWQRPDGLIEAAVQMVLNQGLLGLTDGALDRLQLLCDIETGTPRLDHLDDLAEMPVCPLQPLDDGWVS